MDRASTPEDLADQYATTAKLDIRIEAHQRYSERTDNFLEWVLERFDPRPGESVIDVGCGRGSYHLPRSEAGRLLRRPHRLMLDLDPGSRLQHARHDRTCRFRRVDRCEL